MQLLVTAYAGLEPVESPSRDAQVESTEPDTVILRLSPRFPERAPEIESGRVYRYQDEFEFSAGTHLTHAIFIEQLAGLAGYPAVSIGLSNRAFHNGAIAAKAGPFYELIDFSLAFGTIGTSVCGKLAKDFERFMAVVDADEDVVMAETYRTWLFAFTLASNRGAVQLS
ncbi:hypothetical protein ACVCIC_00050 [Burkholderia glumae]